MDQEAPPKAGGVLTGDLQGKEIRCPDGSIGRVADVLVDPLTERPLYLVWREAVVVTREVSIPVGYVERIEDNHVVLRVEREEIERLPHFWTADPSVARTHANGGY